MATLLPPPKRQKVYHGVPEPTPEPRRSSPNVVVQFVSEEDGKQLAPAVNLPADVSRDALQTLVNKLNTQVNMLLVM
jgi:ribosome assembly protein 4